MSMPLEILKIPNGCLLLTDIIFNRNRVTYKLREFLDPIELSIKFML